MKISIWQLAFRPLFLFGAVHAVLAITLWIAFFTGKLPSFSSIDPVLWHSHEMIYGFAASIVVGFVLTACQNWTGIRGVQGKPLKLLVFLWALPRVLILLSGVPTFVIAAADLTFFPIASYLMIPYLKDPDLKTEKLFFVFYGLLFAGNLLFHLETTGLFPGYGRQGILLGLDTILVVIVFMGGRVIPFFTESSIARAQPKTWRWVEIGSAISAVLFLVTDLLIPYSLLAGSVAITASVIHGLRLWGWQVRRVRRIPLVWVLHVAYLWLVMGFSLSGLAAFQLFPKNLAIHSLTIGCLGTIIFGMISRVSLGHTGRRLHPAKITVVGYYLLGASAMVRVFGPVIFPSFYRVSVSVSGLFWVLAFLFFLVTYTPMLLSSRVDGRAG